jgi:hypothetical protein
MRGLFALPVIALSVALLAGCGTSQTKRAVDSRTEVLRFFPADAQVVALLRTDLSSGNQLALDRAASGIPVWTRLRARLLRQLDAAGLSLDALRPALRPDVESPGPPELAAGAASASAIAAGRPLVILATDHADRLYRVVNDAAKGGHLQPAGSYHEARLYRSRLAVFAVRDGVLVIAAGLGQIRTALDTRDGDRYAHLNDGEVEQLLGELPVDAPLEIYANSGTIAETDPAVRAMTAAAPWIAALGESAVGVHASGSAVAIDVIAKASEASGTAQPPFGEAPTRVAFTGSGLRGLATTSAARPLLSALIGAAPAAGVASYSDGELHAHLILSR